MGEQGRMVLEHCPLGVCMGVMEREICEEDETRGNKPGPLSQSLPTPLLSKLSALGLFF